MDSFVANQQSVQVKLSEVIGALPYALDITEGQPKGHAARSCMIGMRLGKAMKLGAADSSALFYALLLKDLGCSSNAGRHWCMMSVSWASHHEQLDGKGYHRGLDASQLSTFARILAVADIYEALTARRPYRQDLTSEEVSTILAKKLGWGICPVAHEALWVYVRQSGYVPVKLAA
jgi:HD-GYP domain-containing protein (c-di-GMP phosphodiesterase class II)